MAHVFRIQTAARRPRPSRLSRVGHIVRDGLFALIIFGLLAVIIGWNTTPLHPVPTGDLLASGTNALPVLRSEQNIPETTAALHTMLSLPQLDARALLQPADRTITVAILASVFVTIIAFNLWFIRHLGRLYVPSRQGGRKKG